MEHQRCYIYAPSEARERPVKRRRTAAPSFPLQTSQQVQLFRELWSEQAERIQNTLDQIDESVQEHIISFLSEPICPDLQAIRSGLIIAGPSIASHGPFFHRLGQRLEARTNSAYVVLKSGDCPNLKTLLKNFIKKVVARVSDEDEDDLETTSSSRNGSRLLEFDLGHLEEWHAKKGVERIVLVIQDSEAFDAHVLTEMIDLLAAYLDRLPIALLFGIATSAESFEDRLPGKTLRYLNGQKFDVTQSDEVVERLFTLTAVGADAPLRLGPSLCRRMLDRQKDHIQNVQDFSDGLKYAYMSHFYACYPSIFLQKGLKLSDVPPNGFQAVRNLPSYRRLVETLLSRGQAQEVRKLLTSNEHLFHTITSSVQHGQEALRSLSIATRTLSLLRGALQLPSKVSLSSIWIRAGSGEIIDSPFMRETMLSLKKTSSDKLAQTLETLAAWQEQAPQFDIDIAAYQTQLRKLLLQNGSSTPLRSQHDIRNDSLRTTVVAQKVLLSKHKAAMSEQDKEYSDLAAGFHSALEQYFTRTFIDPRTLFLTEVLIYDLKSPHTEVFQPKPRFAIERALGSPHDYLGCNCCGAVADGNDDNRLSSTHPATSILYQLYLESGALINVSDLWSAFSAMLGNENEDNEAETMALFQRALSELKYLGFVKTSRKKTDHISKMMWKGL